MFSLLKSVIFVVGAVVVANFLLDFFDRKLDWTYVEESRARCTKAALECKEVFQKNIENRKCTPRCLEFSKLTIKQ